MKCFYEVLEVSRDVNADDLKKSYKKLALKWHPDKNPDNADEAKERFQLIQQAYEVLGDPRERRWYDNHRETIISGCGDAPADAINLFQYFSPSCYKGFGDDDAGFYAVYRRVFSSLLAEEAVYFDDEPDEVPTFGRSDSDYATVVRTFYNFWCGYGTRKPFGWLDEYDVRQAPNRRVAKLMEKENKKIRDRAKRERNDEIQALVEFVRKRDRRVKAHAEALKAKSAEHGERMEEARRKRIRDRRKELADYKESDWSKFSNVEAELRAIEESLIAEHGSRDEIESDDETDNCLYCVACNKVFKTEKAFQNHENSKKHRENVELIRVEMLHDEEQLLLNNEEPVKNSCRSSDDDGLSNSESVVVSEADCDVSVSDEESCDDVSSSEAERMKLNSKKKSGVINGLQNEFDSDDVLEADLSSEEDINITNVQRKPSKKKKKRSLAIGEEVNVLYCMTCDQAFKTEKALHNHQTSKKHQDNVVRLISAKRIDDNDHNSVDDDHESSQKPELAVESELKEDRTREEPSVEKSTKNKKKPKVAAETPKVKKSNHACGVCSTVFSSKNKLHQHLKDANHAVLKTVVVNERKCKKKGK